MKSCASVGLAMCIAVVVVAQSVAQQAEGLGAEPVGREGPRMRKGPTRGGAFEGREGRLGGPVMGPGGGEEAMVARVLSNPKVAEKLGLSQEQVKTLTEKLDAVRKEIATLQIDLEGVSIQQAHLLTATQTVDEAAVMAAVEKTGEIRTKIAKLMIQQLLTVKKTLTPEQIEKARAMIRERFSGPKDKDQGEGVGPGERRRSRDRGSRGQDEGQPQGERGHHPPPPPEQAL